MNPGLAMRGRSPAAHAEVRGVERDRERLLRFAQNLTIARAVVALSVVALALTLVSAVLVEVVEPEKFGGFGDASWWALQTVSTVGYGDIVPETDAGRTIAGALMLLGVAFVPAITSIVVAVLITRLQERTQARRGRQDDVLERLVRIEAMLAARGDADPRG